MIFYRKTWLTGYLLMMAGLTIDVDHLLADPIYDPGRCGVGFHPLHSAVPIVLYAGALLHPRTRTLGIGLCTHVILDSIDCQLTNGVWYVG